MQSDGSAPLFVASVFGRMECMQLLLDRGAGVDVVDVSSWLLARRRRVVRDCAWCGEHGWVFCGVVVSHGIGVGA